MKAIILLTIMCFSTSSMAAYDCIFLDYGVTVAEGTNVLVNDDSCESGQMILMCGCYGEANMSCSLNELSEASLGERNQICRSQQPDVKPDILSNSIEKSK